MSSGSEPVLKHLLHSQVSCLGLHGARSAGHHPLHKCRINYFLSRTTKFLCISALLSHSINKHGNLLSSSEQHRKESQVGSSTPREGTSQQRGQPEGLSQVPRTGIPPVNPNRHVPRDRTGMVQIQLESALRDEQGQWHGRLGGEGCCSCWRTPLTHPSLRLGRRQVKYLLCLKVLLLSQSVFQRLVVWGQTRHFGELPFVWKTEGRRTGKHNAGWRNLEKGSSIFIVLYTATLDWCGDLIRCWIMQPFPQTYYRINFGPLNVARLADLRLSL